MEVASGGYANVSQGTYEGHRVAIKVVRVYITSDLDLILSVSLLSTLPWLYIKICYRDSAERGWPGSTCGIRTSYR